MGLCVFNMPFIRSSPRHCSAPGPYRLSAGVEGRLCTLRPELPLGGAPAPGPWAVQPVGASGPMGATQSWSQGLPRACVLWDQQAVAGGVGTWEPPAKGQTAGMSSGGVGTWEPPAKGRERQVRAPVEWGHGSFPQRARAAGVSSSGQVRGRGCQAEGLRQESRGQRERLAASTWGENGARFRPEASFWFPGRQGNLEAETVKGKEWGLS